MNVATHNHYGQTRGRGCGQGHGLERGHGLNRNHNGDYKNTFSHQKLKNVGKNEKGGQSSKNNENIFYRCGGKGHWSRTCRTPKHLVDLYQQSLKNKDKRLKLILHVKMVIMIMVIWMLLT